MPLTVEHAGPSSVQPDANSFDVPKQSHRLLPVPKLEAKKHSQNSAMQYSKTNGSTLRKQALPNLRSHLNDDSENV